MPSIGRTPPPFYFGDAISPDQARLDAEKKPGLTAAEINDFLKEKK